MRRFTGPPRPLRTVVQVSEATEAALVRALARNPADRFATAGEFADALAGVPPARPSPAPAPAPAAAQAGEQSGRKGCAAGILIAAASLSALLIAAR
jgi:serine/threonine-protein kinase